MSALCDEHSLLANETHLFEEYIRQDSLQTDVIQSQTARAVEMERRLDQQNSQTEYNNEAELERLQNLYIPGREQKLSALISCAKAKAKLDMAYVVQSSWQLYNAQYLQPGGDVIIRSRILQTEQKINALRNEITNLLDQPQIGLCSLFKELYHLCTVVLLQGDVDLQIEKKQLRLSILDNVLNHMVEWNSTHKMLYDCIKLQHDEYVQKSRYLFKAINTQFDITLNEYGSREQAQAFEKSQSAEVADPKNVIELVLEQCNERIRDAELEVSRMNKTCQMMVADAEDRFELVDKALFGDEEGSKNLHPRLQPTELLESLQDVKEYVDTLDLKMKKIIQDRR
ncbi:hypothetical protein AKO1_005401 [Acrasis kona]|uniref:Uncharacterized protein n=1 Tax=Acrasis kona TaxID=1008807 RepID=A0AAW2YLL0_9EUKA